MGRLTSATLLSLTFAGAIQTAAAEPKVLGAEFTKFSARDLGLSGLQRRANTLTSTLQNAQSDLLYLINVTVGTPGQQFALQLDTGSSDVWVGLLHWPQFA